MTNIESMNADRIKNNRTNGTKCLHPIQNSRESHGTRRCQLRRCSANETHREHQLTHVFLQALSICLEPKYVFSMSKGWTNASSCHALSMRPSKFSFECAEIGTDIGLARCVSLPARSSHSCLHGKPTKRKPVVRGSTKSV